MQSEATTWDAPGCPFQIELASQKLEEIRLAVLDGFYAVPRGGIEIGGVLLGTRTNGTIRIDDYRTIECEHKTGPSFQLSEKDMVSLATLLAANPGGVLGWFHSHTRSEIFLSPADLDIYSTYFPEAWQVALILRPGNMQPTRAGIFFRDASGKVSAEKSAREIVIEPLVREESKKVRAVATGFRNGKPPAPILEVTPGVGAKPIPEVSPQLPPKANAAPAQANYSDLETELATRRQGWWMWVAALIVMVILAACAYVTRAAWLPQPPPPLKLQASDVDGKLFVRWNPVLHTDGKLTVTDGGKDTVVPLDALQVSRGFYVYARQSEKTILRLKAGEAEDMTTFAGPLAPKGPTPEQIQKAKEDEKVRADLQNQTLRNRQLQRKVKDLNKQLREPRH